MGRRGRERGREDGNREERVEKREGEKVTGRERTQFAINLCPKGTNMTSSPSLPYSTPWFFLTAVAAVIGSTTNPRKELSGVWGKRVQN